MLKIFDNQLLIKIQQDDIFLFFKKGLFKKVALGSIFSRSSHLISALFLRGTRIFRIIESCLLTVRFTHLLFFK